MKVKVKRVKNEYGMNDYHIECNGTTHIAIPSSQPAGSFTWKNPTTNKFFIGAIREIKNKIQQHESLMALEPEPEVIGSTWDCVDPVALMIICYYPQADSDLKRQAHHTANCAGQVCEDGTMDVEWAQRELTRYRTNQPTNQE